MTAASIRPRKGACEFGHEGQLTMARKTGKVSCGGCVRWVAFGYPVFYDPSPAGEVPPSWFTTMAMPRDVMAGRFAARDVQVTPNLRFGVFAMSDAEAQQVVRTLDKRWPTHRFLFVYEEDAARYIPTVAQRTRHE